MANAIKAVISVLLLVSLLGCTAAQPKNTDNACAIFKEKRSWYKKSKKAQKKWGTPIPIMLAFIHQESNFKAKAKPKRKKYLGFIPGPRLSSAYGYPQAKDGTWKFYQSSTGRYGDKRHDFADAMYFIGWYNQQSNKRNKIPKWDAKKLYYAYHEGNGGYARGTYKKKPWLKRVAKKVANRSWKYKKQLEKCGKS